MYWGWFQGCTFVVQSFVEYFQTSWDGMGTGNVILMLVEAVGKSSSCLLMTYIHTCMHACLSVIDCLNVSHSDVYLMGTVMLIFGMGLYDLFVNSLDVPGRKRSPNSSRTTVFGSNLFGLFRLRVKIKSHQNNIHFLILYFPFASQPTTIMFAI